MSVFEADEAEPNLAPRENLSLENFSVDAELRLKDEADILERSREEEYQAAKQIQTMQQYDEYLKSLSEFEEDEPATLDSNDLCLASPQ